MQRQCACPAKGAEGGPCCYVALDGTHWLEHVQASRPLHYSEMREEIPGRHEVPRGREEVCDGQQRDDLLRRVAYILQREVGDENEEGAEDGEGARDYGTVGRHSPDIETGLISRAVVLCRAARDDG